MPNIRNSVYSLLRRSEQFFKTDMVYLAKGGFWVGFGQAASSVISLLLVVAFANLLPKEIYGTYRYILSLATVLNVFSLTGMNNAVTQAVAAGHEGALRSSVRYQFRWNLLMLAAFLSLGGYYFLNGNIQLALSFLILGIFVPTTLALNTYGAFLEGKKNFKLSNIASVASTVIYAAGVLTAIVLSGEILWIVVAYAITTFAATLLFYWLTIRRFKPDLGDTGEVLKYGRQLTFIGFIGPIASQIDKIIITHFWGATQLAVYALAIAIPDRATSFIKSWVAIGFPKFATKTPREINTVFYKRVLQGMVVGAVMAAAYIVLAPYVFRYLLPQYLDSILYSQLLAVGFIFAMPNRYVSLLLVSQKYSQTILVNNLTNNIIKFALYAVLGVLGGIIGIVIANILYSFFGMLVNIASWRRASASFSL